MKTQLAMHLFQYWNRLRAGLPAPHRNDIEPSDIRDVLSRTFILESERKNWALNFRLVGTEISNLFGHNLRGSSWNALFQDRHKPVINRLARNCYQERSVIVLELDGFSNSGRQTLLEIIMLPLLDEASGPRILGCLVPHQHQFWHGLDPIEQIDLHSIRVVDPEREPLFLANRPEVGISPALAPLEDNINLNVDAQEQRGMRLLVIQGGKSAHKPREITKR
jgi:hypothetical protein